MRCRSARSFTGARSHVIGKHDGMMECRFEAVTDGLRRSERACGTERLRELEGRSERTVVHSSRSIIAGHISIVKSYKCIAIVLHRNCSSRYIACLIGKRSHNRTSLRPITHSSSGFPKEAMLHRSPMVEPYGRRHALSRTQRDKSLFRRPTSLCSRPLSAHSTSEAQPCQPASA